MRKLQYSKFIFLCFGIYILIILFQKGRLGQMVDLILLGRHSSMFQDIYQMSQDIYQMFQDIFQMCQTFTKPFMLTSRFLEPVNFTYRSLEPADPQFFH